MSKCSVSGGHGVPFQAVGKGTTKSPRILDSFQNTGAGEAEGLESYCLEAKNLRRANQPKKPMAVRLIIQVEGSGVAETLVTLTELVNR